MPYTPLLLLPPPAHHATAFAFLVPRVRTCRRRYCLYFRCFLHTACAHAPPGSSILLRTMPVACTHTLHAMPPPRTTFSAGFHACLPHCLTADYACTTAPDWVLPTVRFVHILRRTPFCSYLIFTTPVYWVPSLPRTCHHAALRHHAYTTVHTCTHLLRDCFIRTGLHAICLLKVPSPAFTFYLVPLPTTCVLTHYHFLSLPAAVCSAPLPLHAPDNTVLPAWFPTTTFLLPARTAILPPTLVLLFVATYHYLGF